MNDLTPVLNQALRTLESLGIPYAVGGSFASGTWGNPRLTRDMDLSIHLGLDGVEALVTAFQDDFMLSPTEIADSVLSSAEYRSFQLLHFESTFKFDIFVRHHTEYDRLVFDRSVLVEISPGLEAWCFSPEDIILQKLRRYDLGNRISDRQWNDVVQVLEVQKGRLDEEYLNLWSLHFEVHELLDTVRSQVFD